MKTVNKNNVCEQFISELDKIANYISRCNAVFSEEELHLSYSYENAILMTYKAFEIFVKRIMISCLNHDHSFFESKYGIALGKHINDDICEFLITKGRYFDFRGYSGLVDTLKGILGNNHPFISIVKQDTHKGYIDQLCAARNYAAHNSKQSKEAAKKAFGLTSISSAGSCLKKADRFSNIISGLKALANEIKTTTLY